MSFTFGSFAFDVALADAAGARRAALPFRFCDNFAAVDHNRNITSWTR
jgi:hypothetical protein